MKHETLKTLGGSKSHPVIVIEEVFKIASPAISVFTNKGDEGFEKPYFVNLNGTKWSEESPNLEDTEMFRPPRRTQHDNREVLQRLR
ncbi:MAG: hypothetical protein EPO24_11095 [Bacteroidetes bacterium]|nr:MAG: hypothetical protein EPO24_11095 [Bacteroidota bacterium]